MSTTDQFFIQIFNTKFKKKTSQRNVSWTNKVQTLKLKQLFKIIDFCLSQCKLYWHGTKSKALQVPVQYSNNLSSGAIDKTL